METRNWFVTIHESADCYNLLDSILSRYKIKHYAYIYHNKEDTDMNDRSHQSDKIDDKKHIHLVVQFNSAKSFDNVFKIFKGAHIEEVEYLNQCYKYLLHLGYEDKIYHYEEKDIITSSLPMFQHYITTDEYKKLCAETILEDIKNGVNTFSEFISIYGLNQVNQKHNIISKLLKEQTLDYDSINTKYIELSKDYDKKCNELSNALNKIKSLENQLHNEKEKN